MSKLQTYAYLQTLFQFYLHHFKIKLRYQNVVLQYNMSMYVHNLSQQNDVLCYMFDISVYYIFIYFINHSIATCVGKRSKFKQPLFSDHDLKYDDAMFGEELF